MTYAIKLVNHSGSEIYLRESSGEITRFPSYTAAMKQHEHMRSVISAEVQSINVVKYPEERKAS